MLGCNLVSYAGSTGSEPSFLSSCMSYWIQCPSSHTFCHSRKMVLCKLLTPSSWVTRSPCPVPFLDEHALCHKWWIPSADCTTDEWLCSGLRRTGRQSADPFSNSKAAGSEWKGRYKMTNGVVRPSFRRKLFPIILVALGAFI